VVRAAAPGERVILFGTSQASIYSAIFAARYPERLTHLVLYGAYPVGYRASGDPEGLRRSEAFLELIRLDWDGPNPVARAMVQTTVFPEPRPQELAWQENLPHMVTREDALRFFKAHDEQDARPHLDSIRTPTLVMATADDRMVLPEWSRAVAAAIPGAVYVELPGYNHVPLPYDPSWEPFFDHLVAFASAPQPPADRLADLSTRERDILDGVCAGLSNEAIALQRNISIRTVRNHLTRIFDKLRVRSRTQAALLASRSSLASEAG
jgi:DNA-binding CsgD family transcriptional regulator/pimeloyl-ACP methyl ester carboxylesterase